MMSKLFATVCLLGSIVGCAVAQDRAHVLVMKDIEKPPIVEGKEFNVTFTIFNVGGAKALDIKVTDSWNSDQFEIVEGSIDFTIAELVGGDNEIHFATLKPTMGSVYAPVGAADIEYSWTELDEETLEDETMTATAKSTGYGTIQVFAAEEYAKYNSQHSQEWTVFTAFSGALILMPYYVWSTKSSKFLSSGKEKKNN